MDVILSYFIPILILFPNLQLRVTRSLFVQDFPVDMFKYISPNSCSTRTIQETLFFWLKVIHLEKLRFS
jgi:hypothetical protein